jgi:hypothetical protein
VIAEVIIKLRYPEVGVPAAPVVSRAMCIAEEEERPFIAT